MGMRWGRWRLGRWLTGGIRDPLWDHFINRAPADPKNNLTPALQGAPEGRMYPVKTEVSDPHTMSRHLKELAQWFGADLVGIVALPPAHIPPGGPSDAPYPFAVVCTIATDYDPREAKGLGGQLAVQQGVVVNHRLRAYIREMGYRASLGGADPFAVAAAAGLGALDRSGRFIARGRSAYIHVAEAVATDLPLAPDASLP